MNLKTPNLRYKIILLVTACFLLVTSSGCDALARKFTRRPKTEKSPQEEMVVAPQEYKGSQLSAEELYRQYFLFWKSWQDELVVSLQERRSQKKQLDCIGQAIINLENFKPLLKQQAQEKLSNYINQEKELRGFISKDIYGSNITLNTYSAERLKRDILRDFSYNKISKDISYVAGN